MRFHKCGRCSLGRGLDIDQIVVGRNRPWRFTDRVNLVYIIEVERIFALERNRDAIPFKCDPLLMFAHATLAPGAGALETGTSEMAMAVAGMEMLKGAVDSHVHCCPHINARTATVIPETPLQAPKRERRGSFLTLLPTAVLSHSLLWR